MPINYATPAQLAAIDQLLVARDLHKSRAVGQNAADIAAEKARQTELGKAEGARQVRQSRSAMEVLKDDVERFVDVKTAQPINPLMPYPALETAVAQRTVKRLSKAQASHLEKMQQALPVIRKIQEYTAQIYGPGGTFERLASNERWRTAFQMSMQQLDQEFPELVAAARFFSANAEFLARSIKGASGPMTEQDAARALSLIPNLQAGLEVALTWPPKFKLHLPDTAAVAQRTLQDFVSSIDGIGAAILGDQTFTFPELHAQP